MDALFNNATFWTAAGAALVGGAVAMLVANGSEEHETEAERAAATHRKPGSLASRLSAGRCFISKSSGLQLAFREWRARTRSPACAVVVLHGIGEHIARYDHIARFLNERCDADVFGYDHQGHGLSEGVRCHLVKFEDLVEDAVGFLEMLQRSGRIAEGTPVFVMGHSMGGLVATHLSRRICLGAVADVAVEGAARNRFLGLVLSSPFLRLDPDADTPVVRGAAAIISSIMPRLPIATLPLSTLAVDTSIRAQYEADPLVYHSALRARIASEATRGTDDIMANVSTFELPSVYLVFGCRDKLVNPEGSREFASKAVVRGGGERVVVELPEAMHEVLNEPDYETRLSGIAAFLSRRVASES
jgi:alpha-beta hydrolase superfamily lysophospholipase